MPAADARTDPRFARLGDATAARRAPLGGAARRRRPHHRDGAVVDGGRRRPDHAAHRAHRAGGSRARRRQPRARVGRARARAATSPAGEWLLDNYYLIEEQVLLVSEDLPARLRPRAAAAGRRRVRRLPAHLRGAARRSSRTPTPGSTRSTCCGSSSGYQEVAPLTIGEVWAVPIMLRIALVENLRRLSRAVVVSMRAERSADVWAERLVLAAQDDARRRCRRCSASSTPRPAACRRRSSCGSRSGSASWRRGGEAVNAWLERRLSAEGIVLETAAADAQQEQAANQVSIANAITSIRLLDALDWREFFESVSIVEAHPAQGPRPTYARDGLREPRPATATRVEAIARRSDRLARSSVAETVVELARRGARRIDASDDRARARRLVAHRRRPLRARAARRLPADRSASASTAARCATTGSSTGARSRSSRRRCSRCSASYALARGRGVVAGRAARAARDRPAVRARARASSTGSPSLVFPPTAPAQARLRGGRSTTRTARSSSCRRCSPRSAVDAARSSTTSRSPTSPTATPTSRFALLGDLRACGRDHAPGRRRRSSRPPCAASPSSTSATRPSTACARSTCSSASRTLQRVRGPVDGLGAQARRAARARARDARRDRTPASRPSSATRRSGTSCAFVITLDADTVLPRDGARKLISAIAHPLNRARWRPGEPRVATRLRARAAARGHDARRASRRSRFARDVLGADRHRPVRGRGLRHLPGRLRRGLVHRQGHLRGRRVRGRARRPLRRELAALPRPRRGLVPAHRRSPATSRCSTTTPPNYLAAASRLHRWVRGDWQTLPWLGRPRAGRRRARDAPTRCRRCTAGRSSTTCAARSSRRPCSRCSSLGWLLLPAGGASRGRCSWRSSCFFPAYFSLRRLADLPAPLGHVLGDGALGAGATSRPTRSAALLYARDAAAPGVADGRRDRARALAHERLAQAPARVGDRRRRREARRHDAARRSGARWGPRRVRRAVAAARSRSRSAADPRVLVVALPLAGAAGSPAPVVAWWVSQPTPAARRVEPLTAPRSALLRRVARKTWRFFETFVVEQGHYLAPDNYQEDPRAWSRGAPRRRTSGCSCSSYVTAYDLGYLTVDGLDRAHVARTLAAMAGLERFRGHFYNWYDIETLAAAAPGLRLARSTPATSPGTCSCCASGCSRPRSRRSRPAAARRRARRRAPRARGPRRRAGRRSSRRTRSRDAARGARGAGARASSSPRRPTNLGEWCALLLERLADLADAAARAADRRDAADDAAEPRPASTSRARDAAAERCDVSVADVGDADREPLALLDALAPWARAHRRRARSACSDDRGARAAALDACRASSASPRASAKRSRALDALARDADGPATRALGGGASPTSIRDGRPRCVELLARLRLDRPTSPARCGSTPTSRCSSTRTASSSRSATTSTRAGSTDSLLRPARERVPPRELPRDRQGRRRRRSTGSASAARSRRRDERPRARVAGARRCSST